MSDERVGLCFRCEYRAEFLENGYRPRSACGDIKDAVSSCYMYLPCKPVLLRKQPYDRRPMYGPWAISARLQVAPFPRGKQWQLFRERVGRAWLWTWRLTEREHRRAK